MKQTIPQDDQAAITISHQHAAYHAAKEESHLPDAFVTIKKMNTILEQLFSHSGQVISDCFLSLLKECFFVDYARLKYQQDTQDWTILSELHDTNLSNDELQKCHQFSCVVPSGKNIALKSISPQMLKQFYKRNIAD
ncbi:MAG: hypothetical protein OMM_10093 [Candidatus Magnetoglobus multicellularis str. Araruama]|uniref:Uncharacterized protein n=1 Tax=Candidatus Magnetoglobus multicellularis str. Araruama TaxID=890399 RepID=A0A1V1P246_9BACT|nr:MAG: hypothetical protein OMM_10093 [Candidatus Magnetoglobus multicellularis str. Araruama]